MPSTKERAQRILDKLESEFGEYEIVSPEEVDERLTKVWNDNCEDSKNWLVKQFSVLIIQIHNQRSFVKKNKYNKTQTYTFPVLSEEDSENLLHELFQSFMSGLEIYDWSTVFNSWIKNKLEWKAISFRVKHVKNAGREFSCDRSVDDVVVSNVDLEQDFSTYTKEELEKINGRVFTRDSSCNNGAMCVMWQKNTDPISDAHTKQLRSKILNHIKQNPQSKKHDYEIFKRRIDLGHSCSQIARDLGIKNPSYVISANKRIMESIQLFLSTIDDEYYRLYKSMSTPKNPEVIQGYINDLEEIMSFSINFDFSGGV